MPWWAWTNPRLQIVCVALPHTYTYTYGNIINNNAERTHFFRKIYLSHFILKRVAKGCESVDVGYVWEVSWRRRETATHWPQVLLTIEALLPHSVVLLNRGPEGPSPLSWTGSYSGILSPTYPCNSNSNCLKLTTSNWLEVNWPKPSVAPGYIIVCFLWTYPSAPNSTTSTGQVTFLYLRPDAPVIYTGASLNWQLGRGSICYKVTNQCRTQKINLT